MFLKLSVSIFLPGGLSLDVGEVLELELHGRDIVPGVRLQQVLDVLVQVTGGNLRRNFVRSQYQCLHNIIYCPFPLIL